MIVDCTRIELIPGNLGADCPGSWERAGMECCCDECDYLLCCIEQNWKELCRNCRDRHCPRWNLGDGSNGSR